MKAQKPSRTGYISIGDVPTVSLLHKFRAQTYLGYYISYISVYKNPTAFHNYQTLVKCYNIGKSHVRHLQCVGKTKVNSCEYKEFNHQKTLYTPH